MKNDVLAGLPVRDGHFQLESGFHTDHWLSLDALFVDPRAIEPLIARLAVKLRTYDVSAICGPLLGGAFLAHALARELSVNFYYAEPVPGSASAGIFRAAYRLPDELKQRIRGERVAVCDDVISAGSSVRATVSAVTNAGAMVPVVGCFMLLGDIAEAHFARENVPLVTLGQREFTLWQPQVCPLCHARVPLQDPRA